MSTETAWHNSRSPVVVLSTYCLAPDTAEAQRLPAASDENEQGGGGTSNPVDYSVA